MEMLCYAGHHEGGLFLRIEKIHLPECFPIYGTIHIQFQIRTLSAKSS